MTAIRNTIKPHAFPLGDKVIFWISDINKYVVVEPFAADIIQQITSGKPFRKIVDQPSEIQGNEMA